MATSKKNPGYKIDFTAKTLTITKEFDDKAQNPASKEFAILMNLQNSIPGLTVIRKTHSTPRKYQTKTGEKFNCNQFKNLTFDNMEAFINGLPNNEELMRAFKFLRYCGKLPQTSRYPAVRKWFVAQFPEFRKNPLFYFYNDVNVIDFMAILEEEQKRAEELEREKAKKEAEQQEEEKAG